MIGVRSVRSILLSLFDWLALPQTNTWTATVLVDELDPSQFKSSLQRMTGSF